MRARKTSHGASTATEAWTDPDGVRVRLSAIIVWLVVTLPFLLLASLR